MIQTVYLLLYRHQLCITRLFSFSKRRALNILYLLLTLSVYVISYIFASVCQSVLKSACYLLSFKCIFEKHFQANQLLFKGLNRASNL